MLHMQIHIHRRDDMSKYFLAHILDSLSQTYSTLSHKRTRLSLTNVLDSLSQTYSTLSHKRTRLSLTIRTNTYVRRRLALLCSITIVQPLLHSKSCWNSRIILHITACRLVICVCVCVFVYMYIHRYICTLILSVFVWEEAGGQGSFVDSRARVCMCVYVCLFEWVSEWVSECVLHHLITWAKVPSVGWLLAHSRTCCLKHRCGISKLNFRCMHASLTGIVRCMGCRLCPLQLFSGVLNSLRNAHSVRYTVLVK